jgi:cytochrome c
LICLQESRRAQRDDTTWLKRGIIAEAGMKIMLKITITLSVLLTMSAAQAQMKAADIAAAKAAFSANACSSCHDASARIVGPALKEIAARYRGKRVTSELAKRIIGGSEGRWGDVPHPSNAALAPAEATLLARWILAGAP